MPKENLIYDPATKSFRAGVEPSSFLDERPSPPEAEKESPQEDFQARNQAKVGAVATSYKPEEQCDPEAGEPVKVKVRKRAESQKSGKKSRHIQFALWIFIGFALVAWISMVSIHFLAGGRDLEENKVSEQEESMLFQ